jgi:hypothetical protein
VGDEVTKEKMMKVIGYIATLVVFGFIGAVWGAFVLCKLWEWFIVEQFGIAQIGITTAIGLSLIVSYLTHLNTGNDDKEPCEKLIEVVVVVLLKPAYTLLFGWIVTLFM